MDEGVTGGRESEKLKILGEKPEAELPRHALTSLNGRRRQDARVVRRPVSAFIHMSQLSALASKYPALCDCLYRPSPGRQEFQHFMRGGGGPDAACARSLVVSRRPVAVAGAAGRLGACAAPHMPKTRGGIL